MNISIDYRHRAANFRDGNKKALNLSTVPIYICKLIDYFEQSDSRHPLAPDYLPEVQQYVLHAGLKSLRLALASTIHRLVHIQLPYLPK